jgi:hypothetical protein
MGQQESSSHNNNDTTNPNVKILEQGDIYGLFCIPKKDAQVVKGVEN